MFGDLELEFGGFAGEGEGVMAVVVVVVIIVFWVGGGLDVGDGLVLLLLMLLVGGSGSSFSAGCWACVDGCSDADTWGRVFGVRVGGEGGKGTVLDGAVAGWSAAEFAGCGAGG